MLLAECFEGFLSLSEASLRAPCRQGRLIDHLRNTQSVGLEDVQTLVLDEADRLLDMGFADEVRSHHPDRGSGRGCGVHPTLVCQTGVLDDNDHSDCDDGQLNY